MPKTYTVKQVAKALDFSTNTVYKYLDEGKIKATRLGTEGRFRIPESEVTRLLGDRGQLSETLSPLPVEAAPTLVTPEAENEEITHTLLNRVANPDLFDWFLALTAIFIGLTEFLYPAKYQLLSMEPYLTALLLTKSLLITSGIILIATDIFVPVKQTLHHAISRSPLILAYILLTGINLAANQYQSAAALGTLALFSFLSVIWHKYLPTRFILFIYLLLLSQAWAIILQPQSFLYFDLRYFISTNPYLFLVLVSGFSTVWLITSLYTSKASRPLFLFHLWLIGFIFFILGLSHLNDQSWTKAVISFCVATFSFLLPGYTSIESLSRYSRRQILLAFSWLTGIIILGIVIVLLIQNSYKANLLSSQNQAVTAAVKSVDSYLSEAASALVSISQSPKISDRLKELYLTTNTFKRLILVSSQGEITAAYPPYSVLPVLPISANEYFGQSLASANPIVYHAYPPLTPDLTPAVYISTPIVDSDFHTTGLILGLLDMPRISSRLTTSAALNSDSTLTITDPLGRIILPSDSDASPNLPADSAALLASNGQSGQKLGYSNAGILSFQSFAPIGTTGWGLLLEQPYAEGFKTASLISFTAFLATLISGVGGLIGAIYFSRKIQ